MKQRKAAVVGAGLGGLSAAIRLAHQGWSVDIYEKAQGPGGKASSTSVDGYRFDTGPSLLTMPHVLKQLFDEVGEDLAEWLTLVPLSPICRYWLSDDTILDAYAEPERFAQEIEEKTHDTADAVRAYLAYCRKIYDNTETLFLWRSLHEVKSYANAKALATLFRIGQIDPFRTMHRANRSFFKDPRVVQLFDRYATYNGSSPFRVPATLNIIPYVEYGLGGYGIEGGIYALPLALEGLAQSRGVIFHYGSEVEAIHSSAQGITGLTVAGERVDCPVVISNADVAITYDLLSDEDAPPARRYRRLEPSSSGLVFYWGIRGETPLEVNNIFFGSDYPGEFRALFEEKQCPADPTVYVNITSKITPTDAPTAGENWFVLVNAPQDVGQDWDQQVAQTREKVWSRITRALGPDIPKSLVCEEVMTPADIATRTGSPGGSLYGISSNSRSAAFRRHPNRSRRHRGLYLCGGSAHPGGGVPLVLLSGKIVSDLVQQYEVS